MPGPFQYMDFQLLERQIRSLLVTQRCKGRPQYLGVGVISEEST